MTNNIWDDEKAGRSTPESNSSPSKQKLVKTLLMGLGALSLIGLGGAGVYYGVKQKPELFGIKNQAQNAQVSPDQVQKIVDKVGKIIELPSGETPVIQTLSDIDKTKAQAFFKNAQSGDVLLIYQNAKVAFIYRPSENKIIEKGFVNDTQPTGTVAGDQTQQVIATETPVPTKLPTPTFYIKPTVAPATPTVSPTP